MSKPGPQLLKDTRARLVASGTSLSAFCRKNGYIRQAVSMALSGERMGAKSQELAAKFLKELDDAGY